MSLMFLRDKEVRILSSNLNPPRLKFKKQIINSSSSKNILNFLPLCFTCEVSLFAILFKGTSSTFESAAEMLLLSGPQMFIIWFRVNLPEQLPRTLENRCIKHSVMDFCHIAVSNTITFSAEFSVLRNIHGV